LNTNSISILIGHTVIFIVITNIVSAIVIVLVIFYCLLCLSLYYYYAYSYTFS